MLIVPCISIGPSSTEPPLLLLISVNSIYRSIVPPSPLELRKNLPPLFYVSLGRLGSQPPQRNASAAQIRRDRAFDSNLILLFSAKQNNNFQRCWFQRLACPRLRFVKRFVSREKDLGFGRRIVGKKIQFSPIIARNFDVFIVRLDIDVPLIPLFFKPRPFFVARGPARVGGRGEEEKFRLRSKIRYARIRLNRGEKWRLIKQDYSG